MGIGMVLKREGGGGGGGEKERIKGESLRRTKK